MAVERIERRLKLCRQAEWVEALAGGAAALLRHLPADMFPQVAELGHVAAGYIIGHRHARQLDDAALDRVHQRKVADHPGEQCPLDIAGTAQEKGRGREIVDRL